MSVGPDRSADIRPALLLGVLTIAILILGFGVWSTTARITGAVITPGKVEVDRNRQVVQHPGGGVVAEILVEDGQMVAAQEVLLRLDTAAERAELSLAEERLFDLTARQERLTAEASGATELTFSPALVAQSRQGTGWPALLAGQRRLFDANMTSLMNQTTQLGRQQKQIYAQISGIEAQMTAIEAQIALTDLALTDQEDLLEKGLSPAGVVLALRREKSVLLGEQGALRSAMAEAQERIAVVEIDKLQVIDETRGRSISTLRELEEPLRQFRQEVQRLSERIAAADIRAPTSGIVYQLAVHTPRAVVRPAEPLMYLIPQDRPRVIAAQVLPQHIDQVRVGHEVKVRLSALDARTTPEVFGTITQVSADAIENQLRGGYYFRVEVELGEGELDKLPQGAVLLPGMPVETFIQTGERSPLAYLVKPISDYLARAFRES